MPRCVSLQHAVDTVVFVRRCMVQLLHLEAQYPPGAPPQLLASCYTESLHIQRVCARVVGYHHLRASVIIYRGQDSILTIPNTWYVTLEVLLHAAFVADENWGDTLEPACS